MFLGTGVTSSVTQAAGAPAGGTVGGAGGTITLTAAAGGAGTSTTGGAGGAVAITAGAGGNGTTSGAAGTVTITAGAAGTGGNVNGGNIDLVTGTVTGTALNGHVRINPSVATPANGVSSGTIASRLGLLFGSTAGLGIYFGSNTPSLTAGQGSLYMRTDGSTSATRAYINSDGGTTWVAVTTAS